LSVIPLKASLTAIPIKPFTVAFLDISVPVIQRNSKTLGAALQQLFDVNPKKPSLYFLETKASRFPDENSWMGGTA
jgi:hypothetical protein